MKVRIETLGCKLNFAESSALMNTLVSRGHERVKRGEAADVVIINTCTVTDTADQKDRQTIHRLRRENPDAPIIITGCYAALLAQRKQAHDLRDSDKAILHEVSHVIPKSLEQFQHAYSKEDRTRCFLKVQDGCNNFCTYCTIPFARGKSRNPAIKELVCEAQMALQEGAKELILTGVNIGDFGRSTGENLLDLLQALDQLDLPNYRIRIGSCEPNLLTDDIIETIAHSKHFAPHFHIPLQSGSNEVLRIMHRHYTRELFAERIAHIRHVMPNAFIGVDCMVGVRGENASNWEDYKEFVQALDISQLHVFTYSERAHTRMLEMPLEVVSYAERDNRSRQLHAISKEKLTAFYAAHKGEIGTVLWEGKRIVQPNGETIMCGFTENYIRVARPYDKTLINCFEQVIINPYTEGR